MNKDMINIFKFTEDGILKFKSQQKKRAIRIFLFILLPFLIAPIFIEELQSIDYLIAMLVVILIMILTSFFLRNIFIDTTIEINDSEIIRKGKNLSYVVLKFSEIGKIIKRNDGIIIYKHGTYEKLRFINDRTALTDRNDVIFIPVGIDSYVEIVDFIEQKTRRK